MRVWNYGMPSHGNGMVVESPEIIRMHVSKKFNVRIHFAWHLAHVAVVVYVIVICYW